MDAISGSEMAMNSCLWPATSSSSVAMSQSRYLTLVQAIFGLANHEGLRSDSRSAVLVSLSQYAAPR